ncbi:glycosyltransferase [Arthrospira platensis]|uniref:Glycosyl transferase n=1 Tax=Limnospira platensis NIES-46 TaxID=1236695 RepID=A0A5M3T079_LIMPL|nr:glycosyltransferase [Arthrospira platensis]AMW28506.1 glycosyl transferase [Arthrospira platensis YZ]KDR55586.1 glycosyl transferase [Arthrospira platensis str. Paraca]MBD2572325.1 glycosyltransferase [Arthrospira platensis FACHB-971]MBD2668674.1 glycosyltransferase [Arthrospira platensis FACHB-439]MBD2710103.1 glycosyltransferase [Arthrospira platensis FACHB-835]MDF2209717.1 glycosyltransferase [Arthrospira platensis NCB002]MDT9182979.1 glycosyltransferase [Limnospira sp. PMC 289.06]MDT
MNIIIFNSLLLPPSQTFIRDPAEKLQKYTAYYVGCRRVNGLYLPPERTMVINQDNALGKVQEQVFKLIGFAPGIYRKIKQLDPVLIHAQFGLSGALVLPWVRSLKIPLIVHYRGADATVNKESSQYTSLNHWIYFQRQETLKREAKLFLTVSKFIHNQLVKQGFPPEKIRSHYHGVDVDKFAPDPVIVREPVVLFVGRLTEKKGCKYLIKAIAQIQSQQPDLKLVIIGDGPLRTALETAAANTLKDYQFLGLQPPEVVKYWMNRARIMATPSITASQGDSEGLPNVVLEAQAMGLPVVSTYHAGIPEAVIDGETGFLSPEGDVAGLAESILRLFNDAELWQKLSQRSREHMEANFNRDRQTRRLEEIYTTVLAPPGLGNATEPA